MTTYPRERTLTATEQCAVVERAWRLSSVSSTCHRWRAGGGIAVLLVRWRGGDGAGEVLAGVSIRIGYEHADRLCACG